MRGNFGPESLVGFLEDNIVQFYLAFIVRLHLWWVKSLFYFLLFIYFIFYYLFIIFFTHFFVISASKLRANST